MFVCILGPGAIGCLFGAFLARSDHSVVMIDHRAERAEIISSQGIVVTGISGDFTAKIEATSHTSRANDADLIVICVKSYDTATAIGNLPQDVLPNCVLLTLQNGLGNVEIIAERFGAERAYAGTTALGATLLGPGRVRHSGKGPTVVGRFHGEPDKNVARIVAALNGAGLEARAAADVNTALWSKVIVNAAINPLTALTGVRNGQLVDSTEARALLAQIVGECAAVARSEGVTHDPLPGVEEVCRRTAQNVSSMLQDILKGRRTEIEAINAVITREGELRGVAAPANLVLTELVRVLERRDPFWRESRIREYGLN